MKKMAFAFAGILSVGIYQSAYAQSRVAECRTTERSQEKSCQDEVKRAKVEIKLKYDSVTGLCTNFADCATQGQAAMAYEKTRLEEASKSCTQAQSDCLAKCDSRAESDQGIKDQMESLRDECTAAITRITKNLQTTGEADSNYANGIQQVQQFLSADTDSRSASGGQGGIQGEAGTNGGSLDNAGDSSNPGQVNRATAGVTSP